MQILNAIDAISPAIARTKLVLFTPFRAGRTWKLCATAYVAFGATIFFPFPLVYLFFIPAAHRTSPGAVGALLGGVALFSAIGLVIFYLCSRLQFAFFDIVLNRGEFVAPAWRKYGPQTWPWIGLKIVFGTVLSFVVAAPFVGYARNAFALLGSIKPAQQPPPELFFAIFELEFGLFFAFGLLFLLGSLLTDFILPSLALENTTLGEACRRLLRLIQREPGQFSLFALMKLVLGVAGYIAQTVAMYVVLFVFIIVVLIVGGIGYLILHVMGASPTVMAVVAVTVGVPLYIVFLGYVVFLLNGTVLTFLQAYALCFLGGRYPMLGAYLDSAMPPIVPPIMPPPGYAYPTPPPAIPESHS
jgi:hypothetical protein